ncbi:ABC-2 type transporter-domain-containing protein [Ilyonectria robusta]|uniref:ABC-2 type transporter-domain-containing protein n=1 Tax=Ilyonectria robusta TaxID=1079257 RepID=UPI001E8D8BFB|nr:ABC-2 type transporter-domain-containing protein [Ilyonectria robusta]KAH8734526.1 ABC-2 type transporter-domain-containing protein [Ilyonectria robusta]
MANGAQGGLDRPHHHLGDSCSTSITAPCEEKWPSERESEDQGADKNEEILDLARRLTTQSHAAPGTLFPLPSDGPLNPHSPDFNARKWAKAFYDIRTDTSEGNPPRTTGVAFKNLNVYGFGTDTDFQKSVGNIFLEAGTMISKLLHDSQKRVDILRDIEGVLHSGEMLAVLGPPGSGCSTFLKTIAGDTHGFHIDEGAELNYSGIHPKEIRTAFRGEAIYAAEVDQHFAHLTVGDTLYFAARARCPRNIPAGITPKEYAEHLRDVTMAMFGISHTRNTRVGDDFVRGVSGGERKRVTIAEAALSYSPLQCWDNSTRGLDSANALEFCRTLRTQADVIGCTSAVAIYQASQDAYDVFDKVLVLYQGRQIFFGKTGEAKAYFERLGFVCPEQQTTADFLTSMTNHQERIIRPGWENKTPRSPDEFAQAWKKSAHRQRLLVEMDDYLERHPFGGDNYQNFVKSRKMDQSKSQRAKSPFTLSYLEQMSLTLGRSWSMLKADPSVTITMLCCNLTESLVVASIFYNLPENTGAFFKRGFLILFIMLMNVFNNVLEILTLYAKRNIVEKHGRYALYHPSAEALSSMIVDLPYKVFNAIMMNTILYFMGNLRREAGAFFFFFLVSFAITMSMSMTFRLIASLTRTIAQALARASILLLAITLYAGFAIPPQYMPVWIGWIRWINPAYYAQETLMINEFSGQRFPCSEFVPQGPDYESVTGLARACAIQGSVPGEDFVSGSAYIKSAYGYDDSHKWRNFGVIVAFTLLFMGLHLVATEYITSERSKGEVLVFARNALKKHSQKPNNDEESGEANTTQKDGRDDSGEFSDVEKQTSVFHWRDVCYDVKIKGEDRRILDHVDGWVKPGTLTALMGASGAGKTTLLDVLASRVTMGVVTGDMLVDGRLRDDSFQRKTGYVQQQDLHVHTSTVREALNFSALLRQPSRYSREEKLAYVDTVINLLDMEEYSDAIIGVPGEGLNVEQRKRLTIGVELAARPQLLLFLDEPTSGLDSQTSWSICNLMEKLTKNGQAILCTIHQPSAMLFQRFDRLLLLSRGRTIYFGDVGKNSSILVDYFVRNGAPECPPGSNPAEYMLDVIGAAPGSHTDVDWPEVWKVSPERGQVQAELAGLVSDGSSQLKQVGDQVPTTHSEFAASHREQYVEVTRRLFHQYWRSPSYIYSKVTLSGGASLFIGLSFLNGKNTERGLQNQMFGVMMFLTIFTQVINQMLPAFVAQRTMYEARERPSRTYSWKAFMVSSMLVEAAWNSLMAVLCFVCWYFPTGLYRNAYPTDSVDSRGVTVLLFIWLFLMFTSTFANMIIAGFDSDEVAGGLVTLIMVMIFSFCGILSPPQDLPGFWMFMYRVNPFTYVVEGLLSTSMANAQASCESNEFIKFTAPNNTTCGAYLKSYIDTAGGYVNNPADGNGAECQYCTISDTNTFLSSLGVSFDNRWRDFGFMWVYILFNIAAALGIYWLARVPKTRKTKKE